MGMDFDLNINNTATTRDMVYEKIYNGIVVGYFRPGERLLERDLAAKMGVSRTPVREALLQLEKANFVHSLPYRGVAVVKLNYREACETYQLRQLLEGAACNLAAEYCKKVDCSNEISLLRQNIIDYRDSYSEDEPYDAAMLNLDFHMMLGDMSGNQMLSKNIKDLQIYMGLLHNVTMASRIDDTVLEHMAIIDALEKGDGKAARNAMNQHLRMLWHFSKQQIDFKNESSGYEEADDIENGFVL